MSDVLERTRPQAAVSDGSHDLFAHVIRKADQMPGYIEGRPVVAACGKTWVPAYDPKRLPLCPDCKRIVEAAGLTVPTS